jgi:hypothetical protein
MFRVIRWPIFREYSISFLTEVIVVHACGRCLAAYVDLWCLSGWVLVDMSE